MKPHRFHADAAREYASAVKHYSDSDGGPKLAARFIDDVEGLINAICQNPTRYRMFDPPARRYRSKTFPYSVIYVDELSVVWILAVMHHKRLPGYWRERFE